MRQDEQGTAEIFGHHLPRRSQPHEGLLLLMGLLRIEYSANKLSTLLHHIARKERIKRDSQRHKDFTKINRT
jgi:hypothetical protein